MKKKLAAALLAIAMLAASLAGCSSPSSSQPAGSTPSSASTAESGEKVLTIAQGGDITTFDMQNHNNGVTGAVLGNFSHGLIERADEDNAWVCVLAESYETIDDSTWEFKLRDDVTWHNGDPFTAADVKWTLERVATDESLAENHIFSVIKEVQIVDDYTVRIITDGPYPTMLSLLSKNGSQMMPSKYIEENGLDYYLENPIGCGPYKFKEWVKDDVVVLERYDDYFGGTPYWDEVRFRSIPEASTRVAELLTGNVDIIVNVPTNEWERIDEGENTEMVLGNGTRIYNVIMKWDSTPTQNQQVREAVAYALDAQTARHSVYSDSAFGDHHFSEGRRITGKVFLVLFKCHVDTGASAFYDVKTLGTDLDCVFDNIILAFHYLVVQNVMAAVFLEIIAGGDHLNFIAVTVRQLNAAYGNQYISCHNPQLSYGISIAFLIFFDIDLLRFLYIFR